MRVAFYTLGCKVNQYETEVLKTRFQNAGFTVVEDSEPADAYIVNSCTVTASGDRKTRQILHRFARQNPNAVLALCGCMPQAFPETAQILTEAQIVTGAQNRAALVDYVKRAMKTGERIIDIHPHQPGEPFEAMRAERFSEHTRAFVKIEDGCDRWCSYCIIPKARGPIRSKPLDQLKEELEGLAQNGYQEIVLVGINLSSYGKENGWKIRLADAVELACSIEGICRVRLGSLEPELLLDEDIKRLAAQPKFCPQFHLSLQSGCDETLRRMNRHYDTAFYRELVEKLRQNFPDAAITTDVMVGFAGETEEEFEASRRFVEEIGFAKTHVFAYSIREGTRAAKFPGQLSKKEKEARSRRMMETAEACRRRFEEGLIGQTVEVLFETQKSPNEMVGYAKNYVPVLVRTSENLQNQIRRVTICSVEDECCVGILSEE